MRRLLLVPALVVLAFSGPAATAGVAQQQAPIVADIGDVVFKPVDPARPDGPAMAVLRGDPATGPSDILLKFKKTDGAPHTHTSGYRAVVVSGQAMHYEKCTCEAAGALKAGSYWYQPGGALHGDACLSDECVIFVSWEGKMDVSVPAPGAK
jgi:hypothetical protein